VQVVGADEVSKIVCGVSSSRELFERAGEAGAQLVLVHHGLFWRNEPLLVDRRLKGRLEALFASNLTLAAYHLALDAHPEVGNNALLADLLGAEREGEFAGIGAAARLAEPVMIDELARRLESATEAARVRRGAYADRARRRRDRWRRNTPHRGCARGLRRARHGRA
jgi:putative NIF3 family GTP cyclohydrolase 1 type 2